MGVVGAAAGSGVILLVFQSVGFTDVATFDAFRDDFVNGSESLAMVNIVPPNSCTNTFHATVAEKMISQWLKVTSMCGSLPDIRHYKLLAEYFR